MRVLSRVFLAAVCLFLCGCSAAQLAGQAINATGKVTVAAIQTTGKVITAGGNVISSMVQIPAGKQTVKLVKRGNSFLVDALINRRVKGRFILDTGCMYMLISAPMAAQLGLYRSMGENVTLQLAGGKIATGKAVTLSEVKVGSAKVRNLRAIIIDGDQTRGYDGLLGMSFLKNFTFSINPGKGELILSRRK